MEADFDTWNSFWDLASNWSSNPLLPGAADDVLIDVAGVQTVTHRSGTNTISSFALTGNASGYSGGLDDITVVLRGDVAVTAVPEPETYLLMLGGLLIVARRLKRNAAAGSRAR